MSPVKLDKMSKEKQTIALNKKNIVLFKSNDCNNIMDTETRYYGIDFILYTQTSTQQSTNTL